MPRENHTVPARLKAGLLLAGAGGAAALIAVLATSAGATSFTLNVDRSATVGGRAASLAVTHGKRPVYELSGEATRHLLCASQCMAVWIPVTAGQAKLTLAPGLSGRLKTVRRVAGGRAIVQLTLSGHPLYTFAPDVAGKANGDGIHSFGGTWHVVRASGTPASPRRPAAPTTPTTPATTPTTPAATTPTTYNYPSGY